MLGTRAEVCVESNHVKWHQYGVLFSPFACWENRWLKGLVIGSGGFHIGSDLTLVSEA